MAKSTDTARILRVRLNPPAENIGGAGDGGKTGISEVEVAVVRRARSRNFKVWIESAGRVGLSYPYGASLESALEFLKKNSLWIRKHLGDYEPPRSLARYFSDGGKLFYRGAEWSVETKISPVSERFIEDEKSRVLLIVCAGKGGNTPSADAPAAALDSVVDEDSFGGVFREFCRRKIPEIVSAIARIHGVEYSGIEVRDQRACWASRSSKGTLSINWRMLLLPPELQNYLVCHELAHVRFMDHSVSFWIWAGRLCPNARALDRKLALIGGDIFKIGR